LASFPAALYLRRPRERRRFTADALLAGFPLASTLLALAFLTWMTTGKLAAMPLQDLSAITSSSHPWARLMGGRFIAPFLLLTTMLLIAAPALLGPRAYALRIVTLAVATAGALASFLDALPAPVPVFVVGAAIALLIPVTGGAAENPAKAALFLAVAMCGGWLFVLVGSQIDGSRGDSPPVWRGSPIGSFVQAPVAGAWGVRDAFARAHPGRVPRLERQGGAFTYVLDE
jgi:hypothetical protein